MPRITLSPISTQLDPTALKALILSQHEQLLSRDNEIEHLKLLIAKLRRMQFGRKSEKLDRQIEQLELRLDELQATQAENTSCFAHTGRWSRPLPTSRRNQRGGRCQSTCRAKCGTYLPKQEACPDCGGKLKLLGEDVSEILEYVPARFKVIRQVRPKLACACCERIVQAASAEPSDRARRCRTGTAGARAGVEILRSLAAVSPVGNLRAGRRGAGTLDAGGLGGRHERSCLRRWWKRCGVTC